jgi:hypothetical protein
MRARFEPASSLNLLIEPGQPRRAGRVQYIPGLFRRPAHTAPRPHPSNPSLGRRGTPLRGPAAAVARAAAGVKLWPSARAAFGTSCCCLRPTAARARYCGTPSLLRRRRAAPPPTPRARAPAAPPPAPPPAAGGRRRRHAVGENVCRHPTRVSPLVLVTSLECHVSESADSDACPRPTAQRRNQHAAASTSRLPRSPGGGGGEAHPATQKRLDLNSCKRHTVAPQFETLCRAFLSHSVLVIAVYVEPSLRRSS